MTLIQCLEEVGSKFGLALLVLVQACLESIADRTRRRQHRLLVRVVKDAKGSVPKSASFNVLLPWAEGTGAKVDDGWG